MKRKNNLFHSVHPKLKELIRSWAKDIHSGQPEEVFESEIVKLEEVHLFVEKNLSLISSWWIFFGSSNSGDVCILPSSHIQSVLMDSSAQHAMVSFVDPHTGGGVTIDTSDEGTGFPVLQVAAWGCCAELSIALRSRSLPD